jgi:ABC-2 type transport system ATP-binding protein
MNIVEARELVKIYKGNIRAVDSISFEVKEGEIFGFLGPNGAGKTTTIMMLVTLIRPTRGMAKVCGYKVESQPDAVRNCIGYVSQDLAVDEDLTGRENLLLQAGFYHLSREVARERIKEVLEMVELSEHADRLVSQYSGGMRKRLDITSGLIHRPRLLFLDEPTLGLDIQTRRRIWDYIRRLRKEEGITIFLTTHYMEEADSLCDRIAIIDYGKIKAIDSPQALKSKLGGDVLNIRFRKVDELERAVPVLYGLPFVREVKEVDGSCQLVVREGEKSMPQILSLLSEKDFSVESVFLKKPSLDDVFLHYTGRELREESGEDVRRTQMALRRARGR